MSTGERPLHQCRYGSCDSQATHTICIMIPQRTNILRADGSTPFYKVASTIARCPDHITIAAENVLSDVNRNRIEAAAKAEGYPPLNFEGARIVAMPIEGDLVPVE